jgi:DNA recombination protein RmuC
MSLEALAWIVVVALLGILAFLQSRRGAALVDLARVRTELEQSGASVERLESERDDLRTRVEQLVEKRGEAQQRVAELEARRDEATRAHLQARAQLEEAFKALSTDALRASSEQFLQLARQTLENEQKQARGDLDQRRQAIELLLAPLRETLDRYRACVQEMEKSRGEAYGALRSRVESMAQDQRTLRDETKRLVDALRRPEVRGRWGEIQLRRVAELAGMIEHCDFVEQHTAEGEDGPLRPDMVVLLPNHRCVVVDAKTPLDAYLRAHEAGTDEERTRLLGEHARQIEQRVSALASKRYADQFERSPELVVLFIPGESFLQAAVQKRPELLEAALARGVVVATPGTLVSLLKVIALGWREERLAEDARRIALAGQELHRRLATAFEHLEGLRKSIERTVLAFNKTVGSLNANVLPQARRFEALAAASSRQLPEEVPSLDARPREVPGVESASDEPESS